MIDLLTVVFFTWNPLSITLVGWVSCVTVALAVEIGPGLYREEKARHTMANYTVQLIAARKAKELEANEKVVPFKPENLYVIKKPEPVRRRHARV